MQTFLPLPDYAESARVLDRARLGKQRVECLQIAHALVGTRSGWRNHPAVKMWRGYTNSLILYGFAICKEWQSRGYSDTCYVKLAKLYGIHKDLTMPSFPDAFHASHRSNLLRKDPDWYGQFGWTEPNNLEYVWPISEK